jgi:hypothetical protein
MTTKIIRTVVFILSMIIALPLMLLWRLADWASDGWFCETLDNIWYPKQTKGGGDES